MNLFLRNSGTVSLICG